MDDANRKMRIRQFFTPMNDQDMNDIWNKSLKTAIQEILKNNSPDNFEELYRNAYTMVLHKHGEKLYTGTREVIFEHLVQEVRQRILESSSSQFLTILKSAWEDHRQGLVKIRCILMYMDRVYVTGQRLEPVYNMGLILFRDNIVRYPIIRERLQNTLLEMVDHKRRDDIVDKTALKDIYQMLISLGIDSRSVYEEDFEKPFLKQLAEFYQFESGKLLAENSISEYIIKVSTLIDGVAQWTIDCFDESTKEHIIRVLGDELITKHMASIVSMIKLDVIHMLTSNKYEEFGILYKHLERFPNVFSTISECMSNYLHEQRTVLDGGKEEQNWNAFVQSLINLKYTFNNFLDISTKYDKTLGQRIQLDFEYLINLNEYIAKRLLSLIDDQLKKGIKCLSHEEMIGLFNKMILLHYSKEKDLFEKYYQDFKQQLLQLISNTDEDKNTNTYVQVIINVLDVKDIFDIFLKTASNEDKIFQSQLSSDLEYIINLNENIPKYLSLFIHDKLQNTDQDVEILFDRVMMLLDYLREKDVFERWYQWHLAQRLLLDKPISDNMENNMILRLKIKCSSQFTYQLEGMFKDIFVSETIMNNFRCSSAQKPFNLHNIVLSVRILNTGFWPIQNTNNQCNLPQLVNEAYRQFDNFYLTTHNGRRLTLQSNLGIADLTAVFYGEPNNDDLHEGESQLTMIKMIQERKYTLQVSTHQMIVLMLFNTRESYSFEEIHQQTDINEKHLQRALLSLIMSKGTQSILLKEPKNNSIQPSDRFYLNDSFISKHYCVKLKPIREKSESNLEQHEIQNKTKSNRGHQIDAAIVRIMKAHKTMEHTQLITQVIHQMEGRFPVDPQLIKRRIELLIESAYLSRSEDDKRVYNYVT